MCSAIRRRRSTAWAGRRAADPDDVRRRSRRSDAGVYNDRNGSFAGTVEISVIGRDAVEVASTSIEVPAGHACELYVGEMLAGFSDLTYAYRFGPLRHEVVVAELLHDDGSASECGPLLPRWTRGAHGGDDVLNVSARVVPGGMEVEVTVSRGTVRVPRLRRPRPDDNWFHLEPGAQRVVTCRPLASASNRSVSGEIRAINVVSSVFVHVQPAAAT